MEKENKPVDHQEHVPGGKGHSGLTDTEGPLEDPSERARFGWDAMHGS